jgi:uncharacterized protein YneF (UPF0154 family)
MDIAALILWVVTALGGFLMLGIWIQHGGHRQQQSGSSRLPVPVVFGHFLLAAAGLVVWIVYVVSDTDALAWVAFVLLLPVALLGFTMLARWIPVRRAASATAPGPDATAAPAERHFPVPVVAAHGLFAVATLVLVLLTALDVGSS